MTKTLPPTEVASEKEFSFLPSRSQFFLLLLSYFLLHVVFRGSISEVAGIDDCDQIVRAQIWSWGYGPQGPVYTWLLKIFLEAFGYHIYSVTLLKELFIFGIYALTFLNVCCIT